MFERIAAGRTDRILAHLAAGGAPDATDLLGTSLLQWAAYYGDTSAVHQLLAHGAELTALGPDLGLRGAAFHGHWQLCEFLIEHGADPRGADPDTGETALHAALGNEDRLRYDLVVEVLLAAGADPGAATRPGRDTGSFMRDCRTRGEAPLHRAAAFGGERTIDLLVGAGARLDVRDANGDSPLAWASWYRRPAAILRKLCFGSFRIHPEYRGMRADLLGRPRPRE